MVQGTVREVKAEHTPTYTTAKERQGIQAINVKSCPICRKKCGTPFVVYRTFFIFVRKVIYLKKITADFAVSTMLVIMNQKKEILEKLAFIRRHKEFASFGVKEQEVSYNPCLSEEDIKEFEHKHCITLPDDYRTFISEIGNGGFGPGYGLLPLDKAIVDFKLKDKPNISLNEKFPYQDSWNEEWITSFNWDEGYPETEIVDAYISTSHIAGSLQISHFGHGCTFLLVVNGNEKGHIWFDGRADYSGLVPKLKDGQRISFIEWYITFLDMEIENINESLTNSTTA